LLNNTGAPKKVERKCSADKSYPPSCPQKSSIETALYAISDGEKYYSVCMSTCQPVFVTKALAYTYDTRAEALEIADKLRNAGHRVGVVRYEAP